MNRLMKIFKKLSLAVFVSITVTQYSRAQEYTSSAIFAHNDYIHPIPFYTSYFEEVGFIEADVFLRQNHLLVAHTPEEIDIRFTLDSLYLKPLSRQLIKNQGFPYPDHFKPLTLMIDLKTDGAATLEVLVREIKKYPALLGAKNFEIAVSGDMPDPSRWTDYPAFIHFDGRPNIDYTKEQLDRVTMISTSFPVYSKWNGKGVLIKSEREKVNALIQQAHAKGKKIRFWAAPSGPSAWITLMKLNIDILGTDDVFSLSSFLKGLLANRFQNTFFHDAYPSQKNHSVSKKLPKNIILLIGDGMGLTQLYSGYTANKGQLNIFTIKDIGFSVTTAADSYITDSAAGATAMATGVKTNNRFIGVDSSGNTLPTITERLKRKGFNTAIISAGDITDATPAAFYAHQRERSWSEAIANDFLSGENDILIGGGTKAFKNRADKKDLLVALSKKGYTVATSFTSLDTIRNSKFVVLDDSAVVSKISGRGDFLAHSIKKSLATLSQSKKSFFMMAEGAQIDYGGHNNNMEYVAREVLDFDQAVGEAMKFVDRNNETLLIITADHETGGLTLLNGDLLKGSVQGNFSTTDHTAVMVPVFAYGPGADLLKGVYSNTALYAKMMFELLRMDSTK